MIYLFSSAYRPLYANDVLNVLAMPTGATVVHRYRFRGGIHQHVQDQIVASLGHQRNSERLHQGKDALVRWLSWAGNWGPRPAAVLLLFVDREDGYTYYPLRHGTLYETWDRDDRLYFRVQLGDFIAAHPTQVAAVSDRIKFILKKNGPGPAAVGQPATSDGLYAILGSDGVSNHADIVRGEDAWSAATQSLSKTKKFASSASRQIVFLRTSLGRRSVDSAEPPTVAGSLERIPIRKDSTYELRVSYWCDPHIDKQSSKIVVTNGESLQLLQTGPLLIQASADDFVVPVVTKRYADDRYSFLNVVVRAADEKKAADVAGASINLLVGLRESRAFWAKVLGTLALFAVTSLVVSLKPSDLRASTTAWDLVLSIWEQVTWWRLVAAGIQAGVLFILFRLIGKKPV